MVSSQFPGVSRLVWAHAFQVNNLLDILRRDKRLRRSQLKTEDWPGGDTTDAREPVKNK